jgi:hypothetical protein
MYALLTCSRHYTKHQEPVSSLFFLVLELVRGETLTGAKNSKNQFVGSIVKLKQERDTTIGLHKTTRTTDLSNHQLP